MKDFFCTQTTTNELICGRKNVAEYLHCSESTIYRNFKLGVYGKAMKKIGKNYILNPEKLFQ